ncbi:cyclic pyranopterin monophosphate synthase MoaC [Glaciecola sp. MH2013]|uniref:cyclic pyranopterin monophosphate synthase MoaC n=1 Tax=Glaciecola sp. MH2013 TaxID=2785524 RepID=UPI00189F7146|nr:cyclic pyranopterin monophosphate synthase MoaC [Glaciecola sp. MH2013]MBF7074521.1 cyclic pyranopterin monophosphate synthase MoaC [Glaciecola sp. MH2013]
MSIGPQPAKLSHVDQSGSANMVDVSDKQVTKRVAIAEGFIYMSDETIRQVLDNKNAKGDVISVARVAGIQGAKKCADLVPLCHPLALSKVNVDFYIQPEQGRVRVEALCRLTGQTGVEMEALTAVSVATLTLFDMCKAVDPFMRIEGIKVLHKEGGKSGNKYQQGK